ncbi:alpha/beta hydrolase [Gordonia sp. CPCC 205515]|uniref:alpha/beta hydrolase n=1 Tax=Gordonia sp. CPCC 205515 TaxID=3140791 RepID=UPI003AF347F1
MSTPVQQWRPAGRGSVRSRTINGYFARVSHPFMAAASLRGTPSAQFLAAMRPGLNRSLTALSPVPAETRVEPIREWLDGVRVRGEWVSAHPGPPRPESPTRIIYYLHGSGYVICSPRTHRGLVGRLSKRTGWSAFSLDYRLGPEYPFPTAGDDAIRGYHWLLDQGFRPDQIVVAGDSAGGHLALDLIADNHRRGIGQPAGLVLFSPLYDPTFELAVASQRRGVRDPLIDAVAGQRFLRLYTGGTAADHPRMRVALHPEMSLPPTLIQVGALEVMGDDARAMHRALTAAGADAALQEWPGQGHVFQMFPLFSPESRQALHEAAGFMSTLATN